jgi:hypothetical protein
MLKHSSAVSNFGDKLIVIKDLANFENLNLLSIEVSNERIAIENCSLGVSHGALRAVSNFVRTFCVSFLDHAI